MKTTPIYAIPIVVVIGLMLLGCNNKKTPKYIPVAGQPNLSLIMGSWKGTFESRDDAGVVEQKFETAFQGQLEMKGELAGQRDVFAFNPLDNSGNPKTSSWANKLYIINGDVKYLTKSYPTTNWAQTDSINFKWYLLGSSYTNQKGEDYKDFVVMKRKNDSLFITSGKVLLIESKFITNSYYRYAQYKAQ